MNLTTYCAGRQAAPESSCGHQCLEGLCFCGGHMGFPRPQRAEKTVHASGHSHILEDSHSACLLRSGCTQGLAATTKEKILLVDPPPESPGSMGRDTATPAAHTSLSTAPTMPWRSFLAPRTLRTPPSRSFCICSPRPTPLAVMLTLLASVQRPLALGRLPTMALLPTSCRAHSHPWAGPGPHPTRGHR